MLYPELEEQLHITKRSLAQATKDNIIEQCKHYLVLLAHYRDELYKFPTIPINKISGETHLSKEDFDTRKELRTAIEYMTRETNRTNAMLHSLTLVSGYEAVDILNKRKYKGHEDWTLYAGGVSFSNSEVGNIMTIQEAVEVIMMLRHEEHIS
jgi:hypothetical protein